MSRWSILAGLLGVLVTGLTAAYLSRHGPPRGGTIYWLLGIGATLPAWLIAFVSLLGRSNGPRPPKIFTVSWILSSSAALLGVIATDAALRRLRESGLGHRPLTSWLLGVVALLPGWAIALLGLLAATAGMQK